MRVREVALTVPDPATTTAWYRDVLGLPVDSAADTVTVGTSVLRFVPPRPGDSVGGHAHLALGIPADSVHDVLSWLAARVDVLTPGGSAVVVGQPGWDSESVYFPGPDGSVLEVIARHRIRAKPVAAGASGASGSGAVLCVSEVGLAVPDVPGAVRTCERVLGIPAFGEPGPTFAAVGTDTGLLVLVPPDRAWFPTAADTPDTGPCTVLVDAPRSGVVDLGDGRVVRSG